MAGEGDHLPTRSGFNQVPSLVVHLGLVGTRIWAGICDHRWVGRELRLSRTAFASSSRQGAAVERACAVKREAVIAGLASEGLALILGSAEAGSSAVVGPMPTDPVEFRSRSVASTLEDLSCRNARFVVLFVRFFFVFFCLLVCESLCLFRICSNLF